MSQREFWIKINNIADSRHHSAFSFYTSDDSLIHVREVNPALDKAIEGLVEALEFYENNGSHVLLSKDMTPENGRFAKEALAAYKAAKEGK